VRDVKGEEGVFLENLYQETSNTATAVDVWPTSISQILIAAEFSELFLSALGTATRSPYSNYPTPWRCDRPVSMCPSQVGDFQGLI